MSENQYSMSFFDRLKIGVNYIETEVKQLKDMTENMNKSYDISSEDLKKTKDFEMNLRKTYVEVSTLHRSIKTSPISLDSVQNQIQGLKQSLLSLENDPKLKNYGYKPFANEELESTFNKMADDSEVVSINRPVIQKITPEVVPNHFVISSDESTRNTNISEKQTVIAAKYVNSRDNDNKIYENIYKPKQRNQNQMLGQTPQPHDFGISRRKTIAPQLFNNNNRYQTPEAPTFDTTNTCRFNYMTTGYDLQLGASATTPPNASISSTNGADSFVTVEFTPGLTTKRPKGVPRVKVNDRPKEFGAKPVLGFKHFPQVLQSVENEKITPEQPITKTDTTKSAKLTKSFPGHDSGTPPMPTTRVDFNRHHRLLMRK